VSDEPWWKSAVIYQIYPRSFADSNGDGVGDLEGIRRHLDHLEWLGVDAIWLSPFFRSPMADFGYDVSDYCDVDPLFGDLDAFDQLLADIHGRGMRLIIDWVPNHSSSEHPWFKAARSSRDDPKRDWYFWRDPTPDGTPPNNWKQAFRDAPAWTLDPATDQLYLHLFLPEQPDLNWGNPDVEAAMHETLRFWLDRGVDGFRMDVIHAIGKDPALPDDPPDVAALPHSSLNDTPFTHQLLRRIRKLLDSYDGERMSVGEVFLLDTAKVGTYLGDQLHLAFNFPPLFTKWRYYRWAQQLDDSAAYIEPNGWPTWVLSNHDVVRHRTRYGSEDRARAASMLLLGLRGTPFVYMGEELGLENADVPLDRVVDPGGRDGCRAPLPWDRSRGHGWGDTEPWLPFPPDASSRSVEAMREEPESILHLYRELLAHRKASPALQLGDQERIDVAEGALAWERVRGDDRRVVAVNFTDEAVAVPNLRGTVEVASDRLGEGEPFTGTLGPDQAVWLRV
jgi:alpha-glucosidase